MNECENCICLKCKFKPCEDCFTCDTEGYNHGKECSSFEEEYKNSSMTKGELFKLLESYPNDMKIEIIDTHEDMCLGSIKKVYSDGESIIIEA